MKKKDTQKNNQLFGKKNYVFFFAGLILIAAGFILMSGGRSCDPEVWDERIFNFRRIRLAPMLILMGFGLEIYAILLNPDKDK